MSTLVFTMGWKATPRTLPWWYLRKRTESSCCIFSCTDLPPHYFCHVMVARARRIVPPFGVCLLWRLLSESCKPNIVNCLTLICTWDQPFSRKINLRVFVAKSAGTDRLLITFRHPLWNAQYTWCASVLLLFFSFNRNLKHSKTEFREEIWTV